MKHYFFCDAGACLYNTEEFGCYAIRHTSDLHNGDVYKQISKQINLRFYDVTCKNLFPDVNVCEVIALIETIECSLPLLVQNVPVVFVSDNSFAISCLFKERPLKGGNCLLHEKLANAREILNRFHCWEYIQIIGHPTLAELEVGYRIRDGEKHYASRHHGWCDLKCSQLRELWKVTIRLE